MTKITFLSISLILTACNTTSRVKQEVTAPQIKEPSFVTEANALHSFGYMFGKDSVSSAVTLVGDFTCDGIQDVVISNRNLDHAQGSQFEIMLLTGHAGEVKNASQMIRYKTPQTSKYNKAYFIGDGGTHPEVSILEITKKEIKKITKSKNACNKIVQIKEESGMSYSFIFDVVYDSFIKQSRYAILEAQTSNGYDDFYNTHFI